MKSKQLKSLEPQVVAPRLIGSCRFIISLVGLFVSFAAISATINLSMAIVCMNQQSLRTPNETEHSNCSSGSELVIANETFNDVTEEKRMYLDKPAQGMLLGGLYYGVVSVQLLVGWLCDKFGKNKLQMVLGSAVLGIASLITPVVLEFGGVPLYFALRIVKGVSMSFALSSVLPMITHWTTSSEQGLLVGIASAGISVANSVTYPISGVLCRFYGWKSIFYFGGACGLLATSAILYFVYDSPDTHPRVSVEEKQYLFSHQLKSQRSKKSQIIPWSKMLLSVPVWSVVITNFFFFAVVKGTVLNLPIFVKDVLDFTVTENGIFSAMPLVGAFLVHIVAGPMFDHARIKYPYSPTTVRKVFHLAGTLTPGALMFVASQLTPAYKYYVISMITIGYSLTEFAVMGGYCYTMIDIAPDFVGILQGINKTLGLAPGFITPLVIAALTSNGTSDEWNNVFLLFGGLYIISGLIFLIFGSAELQKWGKVTKDLNSAIEVKA